MFENKRVMLPLFECQSREVDPLMNARVNYIRVLILSLSGLAPAQLQMDLFVDILCVRNKQRVANCNQSEESMSRLTASAMFLQVHDNYFRGYSKTRVICDCAGEPTHAITTLLSNSLL